MSVDLFECLALSECVCEDRGNAPRVDREKGIVRDVKILGWTSANGRRYEPSGVTAALYEGKVVKSDHVKPGQNRSVRDSFAWLEGVNIRADGVYAKQLRLLNPKGEFEQRVLSAAESAPHVFGLSHTARGREKAGSRGSIIEAVESVQSVDLVDDPASVAGLYESRRFSVKLTVKEIMEALQSKRPKYVKKLSEAVEAGLMSPDAAMDMPPEEETGADHEQAILDACKACLDDSALDTPAKLAKIKKLLGIMNGKETETDTPADDAPDKEESRKRREKDDRLALLEARERLRAAADEAGVKVPKLLMESLRTDMTEAQTKALIAELKAGSLGRGQQPRSATPTDGKGGTGGSVRESRDQSKVPEGDAKAVGKWLTQGVK